MRRKKYQVVIVSVLFVLLLCLLCGCREGTTGDGDTEIEASETETTRDTTTEETEIKDTEEREEISSEVEKETEESEETEEKEETKEEAKEEKELPAYSLKEIDITDILGKNEEIGYLYYQGIYGDRIYVIASVWDAKENRSTRLFSFDFNGENLRCVVLDETKGRGTSYCTEWSIGPDGYVYAFKQVMDQSMWNALAYENNSVSWDLNGKLRYDVRIQVENREQFGKGIEYVGITEQGDYLFGLEETSGGMAFMYTKANGDNARLGEILDVDHGYTYQYRMNQDRTVSWYYNNPAGEGTYYVSYDPIAQTYTQPVIMDPSLKWPYWGVTADRQLFCQDGYLIGYSPSTGEKENIILLEAHLGEVQKVTELDNNTYVIAFTDDSWGYTQFQGLYLCQVEETATPTWDFVLDPEADFPEYNVTRVNVEELLPVGGLTSQIEKKIWEDRIYLILHCQDAKGNKLLTRIASCNLKGEDLRLISLQSFEEVAKDATYYLELGLDGNIYGTITKSDKKELFTWNTKGELLNRTAIMSTDTREIAKTFVQYIGITNGGIRLYDYFENSRVNIAIVALDGTITKRIQGPTFARREGTIWDHDVYDGMVRYYTEQTVSKYLKRYYYYDFDLVTMTFKEKAEFQKNLKMGASKMQVPECYLIKSRQDSKKYLYNIVTDTITPYVDTIILDGKYSRWSITYINEDIFMVTAYKVKEEVEYASGVYIYTRLGK